MIRQIKEIIFQMYSMIPINFLRGIQKGLYINYLLRSRE